jgi:hypothetical protein
MREEFNFPIKSCAIRTVPAAETKSIGLQADAQLSWFLHATLTTLRDMTIPTHLSGPSYQDSFIVTPNASPPIGTLQKHMPTLSLTAPN